ncbi:MAG TPA: hypothetical protein PLD18_06510 [Flavobacterium sp.]|nr:hypothetical protein [Flavobacterium sp.]HRA73411.1 hypothetical protein [Flavobacterium sp.]
MNIIKLENKNQILGKAGVFKDIFDYTFLKIANEFIKINNLKSLNDFNKRNDINIRKLLLYPFFIATSNGHSRSLYDIYGGFYALTFGPVSDALLKEFFLKEGKFDTNYGNSNYFIFNNNKLEFKPNYTSINDVNVILEEIKSKKYNINGTEVNFSDLKINKDNEDENSLIEGIESGFKHLNLYTNNNFFNSDEDALKFHSFKYSEFANKFNQENKLMDYDEIIKDKKRLPFYPLTN